MEIAIRTKWHRLDLANRQWQDYKEIGCNAHAPVEQTRGVMVAST